MPGKLPGGKVRISKSAPSIIKKTKNPATSEVKYFGLVRDLYLNDLTDNSAALKEVLIDIQDPAERNAEGEMKVGDLAIIDGIVDSEVKNEDLSVLAGVSLSDEEGGVLISPRYRLSDRIAQFATFAGRGIEFIGAGPVKFTYIAPLLGDLLPGTVSVSTAGVVTGSGTTFNDESGLDAEARLNKTLAVGDFVALYEADGVTLHRTGSTPAEKKADEAIYKVTNVASNSQITLSPAPSVLVSGGKKLRKRYSHSSPPPFFTENIDSVAFNAPDTYPSTSNYIESHRLGFLIGGQFEPTKGFEDWWEGAYNHEMKSRGEYGSNTDTSATNPKFPIVKDGNLNFERTIEGLPQGENIGFRWDFWMRKGFTAGDTIAKFKAQVNGHLKIDYFEQTGYSGNDATGSWKTAIDTTDSSTFFTQTAKEAVSNNRLGFREIYIQGGPDFKSQSTVDGVNSLDLSLTYDDEEGNSKGRFLSNYVPVVLRYWYGQDTIDNSSTPISQIEAKVNDFVPSLAIDTISTSLPPANLQHWNSYAGFLKLKYVTANSRWSVVNSGQANYDGNTNNFADRFEVVAYTGLNSGATGPVVPAEAGRNVETLIATGILFGNTSDLPLIAQRYDNGSSITNNEVVLSIPGIDPSNDDVIYILAKNRPNNVVPKDTASRQSYSLISSEIFAASMFNPDPIGKYRSISDLIAGGPNFIEPDPLRNVFEDNVEYFKYKLGRKPGLNTYGPDRYDGFIKNRISSSASDYDTDYTHPKILPIGRQRKSVATPEPSTGNLVTDPKALSTDVTPTEVRTVGENYTFISVEEDEAGNGGEITLMGFPINTLAAINNTAGQGDGGRILHSNDNSFTFSNANRQNISDIDIKTVPGTANFDDDNTFTANKASMSYVALNSGAKLVLYPAVYATNPSGSQTFNATTRGMVSRSGLGVTEVTSGTNGRSKSTKSVFFTGFKKNTYSGTARSGSGDERFFIDFLLGTRPNAEKVVSIDPLGSIADSTLFSNLGGNLNDANGVKLYDGALIEFYANTDELSNSGNQVTGEDSPTHQAYVTGYNATDQKVTYAAVPGKTVPTSTGNYAVRVYYNYLEITKVPDKTTNNVGTLASVGFSETGDGTTTQMRFVYNSSYGLSKADTGVGLSFAETLYVKRLTSPQNPELAPFDSQTELPSPPSVTVTPFGFDNQPTNPANPGLGGLCYPPYQTQDLDLKPTVVADTALYASTVGEYDMYFGSPQISQTTLGDKFLQVTDEFAFDFSEADRPRIVPEGSLLTDNYTLPTFTTASYTHKLRVNLNPYIGSPDDNTGLYTVRGNGDYTTVANDNIFKDALVFSNNKPVKETFFLFAKKGAGSGEAPISILSDNDPGYT